MDRILDFTQGQDKIDLSGIDADTAIAADQSFNFVGNTAFSNTAGELYYSNWKLTLAGICRWYHLCGSGINE
jgi:hypothetical protein